MRIHIKCTDNRPHTQQLPENVGGHIFRRSEGVLYGQETEDPHSIQIRLIIVRFANGK